MAILAFTSVRPDGYFTIYINENMSSIIKIIAK